MIYTIEIEREEDGRWIAEVSEFPGCLVYGNSKVEAVEAVAALMCSIIEESEEAG